MRTALRELYSGTIWKKLIDAMKGKKILSSVLRKNKISNLVKTHIILFPEYDKKLNYYGTIYIDEYLLRNAASNVLVLYCDDTVANLVDDYVKAKCFKQKVETDQMANIISFYSLYIFTPSIKIISLDLPQCRNGRKLLSSGKLDFEQIVAVGIFHIIPLRRKGDYYEWTKIK